MGRLNLRLIIDLQGAQGDGSAKRGIGRYSRELALAMARAPRSHDVVVALNGTMTETAESLCGQFSSLLPPENIRCWFAPVRTGRYDRSAFAAEHVRAEMLASLRPDIIHVSSLFEGLHDACVTRFPATLQRPPQVATCYDLIPLIRRKDYLHSTDKPQYLTDWYYRCVQEMSLMDGLLAISESSRREAIDYIGFDPRRIFDVKTGINVGMRPANLSADERRELARKYGLEEAFILFVGAGDLRKNEPGLVEAYSRLPASLRARHQLVIVGHVDAARLRDLLIQRGVGSDRLAVIPFVEEGDLVRLYSTCALFVFPSIHEGFGLPAAEAMACGAPVVASNTSSLPEVVGLEEAMFDPTDPQAIAERMVAVLTDDTLRSRIAAHGLRRSADFNWPACAERAWDALEQIYAELPVERRAKKAGSLERRPSLAFVSPLAPKPSGISDYSRSLLPSLARHYDITLVTESGETSDPWLAAAFRCIDPDGFLADRDRFDRVLYQLGGSEFHLFQYRRLLPAVPGVAVLHDAYLSYLWNWMSYHEGRPGDFREKLYASHGYPALQYEMIEGRDRAAREFPMSLEALEHSRSVILHSHYAVDLLRRHFDPAVTERFAVIPHLAHGRPKPDRAAARARLGLKPDEFVVGSFGIVGAAKLPGQLLAAWTKLPPGQGRLVFVGAVSGTPEGFPLKDGETANDVHVTGRVDQDAYDDWLAAVDLAVQLRTDSRGESSGTITDCLCFDVPLIVNDHGTVRELPSNCAYKLPDAFDDADLSGAIASMKGDVGLRRAFVEAGRDCVETTLKPAVIAQLYRDAIELAYTDPDRLNVVLERCRHEAQTMSAPGPSSAELDHASEAIAATFSAPLAYGRLLIAGLGGRGSFASESVLPDLARHLLTSRILQLRVETVRFARNVLCFDHDAATDIIGCAPLGLADRPVDTNAGDLLVVSGPVTPLSDAEVLDLRRRKLGGLRIVWLIETSSAFIKAAEVDVVRLLALADSVLCGSRDVVDRLKGYLTPSDGGETPDASKIELSSFGGPSVAPAEAVEVLADFILGKRPAVGSAGQPSTI